MRPGDAIRLWHRTQISGIRIHLLIDYPDQLQVNTHSACISFFCTVFTCLHYVCCLYGLPVWHYIVCLFVHYTLTAVWTRISPWINKANLNLNLNLKLNLNPRAVSTFSGAPGKALLGSPPMTKHLISSTVKVILGPRQLPFLPIATDGPGLSLPRISGPHSSALHLINLPFQTFCGLILQVLESHFSSTIIKNCLSPSLSVRLTQDPAGLTFGIH